MFISTERHYTKSAVSKKLKKLKLTTFGLASSALHTTDRLSVTVKRPSYKSKV